MEINSNKNHYTFYPKLQGKKRKIVFILCSFFLKPGSGVKGFLGEDSRISMYVDEKAYARKQYNLNFLSF